MLCWNVLGRRCRFFTEVRDIYSKKFPELLGKKPENLRSFPASGCVDVQQLLFRVIIDHIVSESWRMINSMKGPELKLKYVLYQAQQRTCQGIPGPIAILLVNDRAFHVQFGGGSIFIDQMMSWRHVCGMFVTSAWKQHKWWDLSLWFCPAIYKCFSGPWIPMVLNPHGTSFCAMVHVGSTGRYLTSSGTWNQRLLGALLRLESIVTSPLDYLQVVQRIGNTKAGGRSCGW